MSHTSGGGHGHGGHHGVQGGHPDQSAGWSSALQGGNKPITSLPNPTILPIFFALFVFVLMLLPFCINWDAEGVELPWAHKQNKAALEQQQQQSPELTQSAETPEQAAMQDMSATQQAAPSNQTANSAAPASYEQQLLYASKQSFAQNANQQTQAVNTMPQQNYSQAYPQENYGQNYAPVSQPQQRHRVWVER